MIGDRESFGRNSSQLIRLVLAVAVLYRHSFDLLATGHTDIVLDLSRSVRSSWRVSSAT